jgi:hypothetical protein
MARTWRFSLHNEEPLRALRARGAPFVLAVWHGDMLAPIWAHRRDGLVALVSAHRDGEIISRIIAGIGLDAARGSTTRGGSRALLTLIRALEAGRACAFTPDGPRGPRRVLQPGMLAAARRAGVPVVLIGVAARRSWRFRSWDQFVLPKPFAKVHLAYSAPTLVDAAADDVSTEVPRFAALMNDTVATADAAANND